MWVSKPLLRKDAIDCHCQSNMHKEALDRETTRLSVERYGGIEQAFMHFLKCVFSDGWRSAAYNFGSLSRMKI